MSDSTFLPIGTWLASRQYRIVKHLGEGGFGKTYLVENRLGEKKVVKEFFISSMCTRDTTNQVSISVDENKTTFEQQLGKFEKEALMIFSLSNQRRANGGIRRGISGGIATGLRTVAGNL